MILKLVTETAVFSFYAGSDDGKNSEVCRYASILEKSELVAQRLSADSKGNSMKYVKQGPREFVPFDFSDITLENIRKACKAHYREDLACDILASEQGPSCSRLDQVPSFKVIYVRFIKPESWISIPTKMLEVKPFKSRSPFQHAKVPKSHVPQLVTSHET